MTYDELVDKVAAQTGAKADLVKEILFVFPDALVHLKPGEQVRTPLGVFTMRRRSTRKIRIPNSKMGEVPAQDVVRLKSGKRLRLIHPTTNES